MNQWMWIALAVVGVAWAVAWGSANQGKDAEVACIEQHGTYHYGWNRGCEFTGGKKP